MNLKAFIDAMKFREQEQRRIADDARLKAEVIQKERMELEHYIYKEEERLKQLCPS